MKNNSMTQIAKLVLVIVCAVFSFTSVKAQSQQAPSKEQFLSTISAQEWLETMQPEASYPIFEQVLFSLNYAVTYPQDAKSAELLDKSKTLIAKLDGMKSADRSDVATLKGFYYTALIVQNTTENGPKYYKDALNNYTEALRLNLDNKLAQFLKAKFDEGMKAVLESKE